MSLVDDCVKALGSEARIVPKEETSSLFHQFMQLFQFTSWGRIDWTQVEQKIVIDAASDVLPLFMERRKELHDAVFIVWDEVTKPAVESKLINVITYIDAITIVSFDTWIFCPKEKYVIEFYHEGEITIGFK